MSHTNKQQDPSNVDKGQTQLKHQTKIKPAEGFALKENRLAVHSVGKRFFGRIVPYYRLCVEGLDEQKEILQSVDIPVARFQDALGLMERAFKFDQKHSIYPNEDFSKWGARKGYPFFTELLEDILSVGSDDLPHLLDVKLDSSSVKKVGLHII